MGQHDLGPEGIPESTFYAIRRKAYEEGWLIDRYVPNPWATGAVSLECILAKPGASERAALEKEWAESPENVLLWSGLNSVFGVFFRKSPDPKPPSNSFSVGVTRTTGSLPAYFDYSRLWARFLGANLSTGYPRSLAFAPDRELKERQTLLRNLLALNVPAGPTPTPRRNWHTPSGLPRSLQRLLDWGVAQSRTFLNAEAVPPYQGRVPSEVVFITGNLKPGSSGGSVLAELNQRCNVSPFLVADNGRAILIVTLGQLMTEAAGRRKVRTTARPVLSTLEPLVGDVQVTIERVDGMKKIVDHRYDRVVAE